MVRLNEIRENEVAVAAPPSDDAGLVFIGTIRTDRTLFKPIAPPQPGDFQTG